MRVIVKTFGGDYPIDDVKNHYEAIDKSGVLYWYIVETARDVIRFARNDIRSITELNGNG